MEPSFSTNGIAKICTSKCAWYDKLPLISICSSHLDKVLYYYFYVNAVNKFMQIALSE